MSIDSLLETRQAEPASLGVRCETGSDLPAHLWKQAVSTPVENFLSRPGKRFRAELVELSYRLAGGRNDMSPLLTEAIELLHAGSLIIDDIEDGSLYRRGQPALHRLVGEPRAINAGNWMYFRAFELLTKLPVETAVLSEIASTTATTVRKCHEGQALDLSADVTRLMGRDFHAVVLRMTELKTGGLMSLAAWLGATTARADGPATQALSDFGMQLGVSLQMLNDLAELQASAHGTGRGDDLRNRRVTWPWAWLARLPGSDELPTLQRRLLNLRGPRETSRLACALLGHIEQFGQAAIRQSLWRAVENLEQELGDGTYMRLLKSTIERVERSYAG